jgi:hypothetical protein
MKIGILLKLCLDEHQRPVQPIIRRRQHPIQPEPSLFDLLGPQRVACCRRFKPRQFQHQFRPCLKQPVKQAIRPHPFPSPASPTTARVRRSLMGRNNTCLKTRRTSLREQ